MTDYSPQLRMPLLEPNQHNAQALVNEMARTLDAHCQILVLDRDLTAPPGGEDEGDCFLVDTGATDEWLGHDGEIANFFAGNGYRFTVPKEGWVIRVADENVMLVYDGAAWQQMALISDVTGSEPTLVNSAAILAPTSSLNQSLFFTPIAITITQIRAVVVGSAVHSVTWNVKHSTDRSASGNAVLGSDQATSSLTSGDTLSSFSDATIPAGSWVWLTTSALTAVVTELVLGITYTED